MSSLSKQFLSSSTNGRPIAVAGTSSASATTLHAVSSGTAFMDVVSISACNVGTVDTTLTIELGSSGGANEVKVLIPPQIGFITIVGGISFNNSQTIKAYAGSANIINVVGDINRIS